MDRRGFLKTILITASAPAIVRISSLMPVSTTRNWEHDLVTAAVKEITGNMSRAIAQSRAEALIVQTGYAKLLWPGVKAYWDEAYKVIPIHWEEIYKP